MAGATVAVLTEPRAAVRHFHRGVRREAYMALKRPELARRDELLQPRQPTSVNPLPGVFVGRVGGPGEHAVHVLKEQAEDEGTEQEQVLRAIRAEVVRANASLHSAQLQFASL